MMLGDGDEDEARNDVQMRDANSSGHVELAVRRRSQSLADELDDVERKTAHSDNDCCLPEECSRSDKIKIYISSIRVSKAS